MDNEREAGTTLNPKYDASGLITAVITDSVSGSVLMVGHMNADALRLTIETNIAHFWSRSRNKLWKKGESSGHFLNVVEMFIDCDQDSLWIKTRPDGPTCHTGVVSCFYRQVTKDGLLKI
jgi:phosphoribosyl-AMP cyclohydrolase